MTPVAWVEYAAAALARERERPPIPRCYSWTDDRPLTPDGKLILVRCTLRDGHEGAHR